MSLLSSHGMPPSPLRICVSDAKIVSRSLTNVTYFTSTQTVALTVFGITAGVIMTFTRRYKWLLFIGLCIRLVYALLSKLFEYQRG